MHSDRPLLTDHMGARIAPLCPGKAGDPGGTAKDNRIDAPGTAARGSKTPGR